MSRVRLDAIEVGPLGLRVVGCPELVLIDRKVELAEVPPADDTEVADSLWSFGLWSEVFRAEKSLELAHPVRFEDFFRHELQSSQYTMWIPAAEELTGP